MSEQNANIIAIVTTKVESIRGGGAPVFIRETREELQAASKNLEKILDAAAHELDESTMLIVTR